MVALMFLIYLIALQAIDAYTTIVVIKNGGRELNPILNYIFLRINFIWALIIIKLFISSIIVYFYRGGLISILIVLSIIYTFVVINNIKQFKKGR